MQEIKEAIQIALKEDCANEDVTSLTCIDPQQMVEAHILLKEKAKIAALFILPWVFENLSINLHFQDGDECDPGTILATISGPAGLILSRERTALNIIQHASAIATITQKYVKAVEGFDCDILDTRKTLPSLRQLQKYAVRLGGGKNHRYNLKELILIKNNHLSILKSQGVLSPVKEAVSKAKSRFPDAKVEVEVEDLAMVEEALQAGADLIMLDNMQLPMIKEAVKLIQKKAYIEASGGMTLDRVPQVAEAGVDGISIGALTHSVKAIDLSLKVRDCL